MFARRRRNKGSIYEDLACFYLEKKGLKIIGRNFRSRFGEIDIVAREGNVLCFIEVKKRKKEEAVSPGECFDMRQIDRMRKTSLFYLSQNSQKFNSVRYDFLFIIEGSNLEFDFIRGAFDYE